MNKVFGIGMFKTGTKSLGAALQILGYHGTYRPWFVLKDKQGKGDNWYRNPELWLKYYAAIKARADQYNAFSDAPWIFLYKQLDKWYPGSKFILTLRKDVETQARSDLNQWRNKKVKPSLKQFINRYNKHNNMVLDYFKGKNNLLTMCFEEGDDWFRLCKFLNKSIPKVKFPHANKGRYKK